MIHFGTGTSALLEAMREAGSDIMGIDSHVELDEAWARLGNSVGVQGNLDPVILYADQTYIRSRAESCVRLPGGRGISSTWDTACSPTRPTRMWWRWWKWCTS